MQNDARSEVRHCRVLPGSPEGARLMAYDVRLATRITATVDHRLRMLALIQRQSLSHVLSVLLDQALPPADELASLLKEQGRGRGMTAVCSRCGEVYWAALGHSCHLR